MGDAFRLGGWGMYPTLFVGMVLIVFAARFALSPARGRLAPIVGLGVLTTLTASLGFVTGVIKTLTISSELDVYARGGVIAIGIGESLHNIGLGLVQLVLATTLVVVGLARGRAHGRGSALVDPLRG